MIATVALEGRKGEMDACSNLIASEEAINEDRSKRREGGPKGRPSEASLNLFFDSWLILVNVRLDQIEKFRKLICGNTQPLVAKIMRSGNR